MDLDPVYLPYAQVNGVPQESKLATYMKRPPDSNNAVMAQSLSKTVSSMSLEPLLSMKKVLAQSSEFVPRNSVTTFASRLVDSSNVSPQPNTPSPTQSIVSPTPHSLVDKSLPTYQENFGGTTYFYQAPTSNQGPDVPGPSGVGPAPVEEMASPSVLSSPPGFTLHPGTPPHVRHKPIPLSAAPDNSSFYMTENIRAEIQHKNALTLVSANPELFPELPLEVDNYHDLVPLERIPTGIKPNMIGYLTSTYKATNIKSGTRYCLRRVHNFRLPSSKCLVFVDMWKKLSHSNIVQLREVFTTKAFGDHSIVFVYDYHPNSETLKSKHFPQNEQMNNYGDGFSANPLAPRPYSHSKNTMLRQQHSSLVPESTIWSYIIQLTGALRVIHSSGLACRCLDPSKVLLTGLSRSRIRLSGVAVSDVLTYDASASNPQSMIAAYQQDDLTALGRLILNMTCGSLRAVQRENIQTSIELMSRNYSMDLRNLVLYLLPAHQKRTVVDLMPMIGARYYTQLDAVQLHGDCLENELAKEMENGRLFRLLVKLGSINERPDLNMDPTWSETGDRYMLKLFRDYLLHQVQEDGRPWLDMSHIVHCLNKLDAGTQEKICLMSRDEQSVLVVSYAELKQCLDQSFLELSSAAALNPKSAL